MAREPYFEQRQKDRTKPREIKHEKGWSRGPDPPIGGDLPRHYYFQSIYKIEEQQSSEVKRSMIIETERLILREYTWEDFDSLYEIVSDAETMQHYPKPFDEERTKSWIEWNLQNYEKYGFGLWAVVLKETGEFIGDCGITIQDIDGENLPEIGYHIHKRYWRRGFGSEAAKAARDWAFNNTEYNCLYSYMKYTNIGSYSTAVANGMKKVKEYPDEKNGISYAYAITRKEWEENHKS